MFLHERHLISAWQLEEPPDPFFGPIFRAWGSCRHGGLDHRMVERPGCPRCAPSRPQRIGRPLGPASSVVACSIAAAKMRHRLCVPDRGTHNAEVSECDTPLGGRYAGTRGRLSPACSPAGRARREMSILTCGPVTYVNDAAAPRQTPWPPRPVTPSSPFLAPGRLPGGRLAPGSWASPIRGVGLRPGAAARRPPLRKGPSRSNPLHGHGGGRGTDA